MPEYKTFMNDISCRKVIDSISESKEKFKNLQWMFRDKDEHIIATSKRNNKSDSVWFEYAMFQLVVNMMDSRIQLPLYYKKYKVTIHSDSDHATYGFEDMDSGYVLVLVFK